MVPEGWTEVPLGALLKQIVKPVLVDPTETYYEIGVRSHGKGIFYKEPVTGRQIGNKRVFWVVPDCLVLNIIFAWEQAVARTTSDDVGRIASHRFPLYRPIADRADLDYLTYLFRTPYGKHLLGLASPGGAGRNKTLGQKAFRKTLVRIPKLHEQKGIVNILRACDAAIQCQDKLVQQSLLQKEALMDELLTGRRRLPGFSRKWVPRTIASLGPFKKGKGLTRDQLCDAGAPCILYGDLYTTYEHSTTALSAFVSPEAAAGATPIRKGDLLFAGSGETAAEIGKCVAYLGEAEAYAGGDIIVQTPADADSEFLGYLLNSSAVARQKARVGQGHSVVHIRSSHLGQIKLTIPDREEQAAIASVLAAAHCEVVNSRARLYCLRRQKRSLMQQLLTGKRRLAVGESTHA